MAALGFPDINLPLNRLTEEIGKLCKNAQVSPLPRSALGLSCVKRGSSRTENGQAGASGTAKTGLALMPGSAKSWEHALVEMVRWR